MSKKLKYQGYSVVFQEVPNETSLVFNISGCPHKCEGCHSKNLWEYEGSFLEDDYYSILDKYNGLFSCVCFMGGDQNVVELSNYLQYARDNNLKTCLYSGFDEATHLSEIVCLLDYLKIGSYKESLGGLDCQTTNQKMFHIYNSSFIDVTNLFQNKSGD